MTHAASPAALEWSGRDHRQRVPRILTMPVLHCHPDNLAPQADAIAARLAEMPRGRRALMFDGFLAARLLTRPIVDQYAGRGEDEAIDAEAARLRPVIDTLARRRVMPATAVLDSEGGANPHGWIWTAQPPAWQGWGSAPSDPFSAPSVADRFGLILDDQDAAARLPRAIAHLRPEDFTPSTAEGRRAIEALADHAAAIRARCLREVLRRAGLPVHRRVFVANFNDLSVPPGQHATDPNGWREGRCLTTDDAAPSLYPSAGGDDPDALWRAVCRSVTTLRACLAGIGRGSVRPFIGPEHWSGADAAGCEYHRGAAAAWRVVIVHALAAGVRTLLVWNPHRPTIGSNDAERDRVDPHRLCDAEATARALSAILREFHRRVPVKRGLPGVEPGAREIRTPMGDGTEVVTTYDEFVRRVRGAR